MTMTEAVQGELWPADDDLDGWVRLLSEQMARTAGTIVETGRAWARAKARVPHGSFGELVTRTGVSARSVQRLMAIASNEALAKSAMMAGLPSEVTSLELLAKLPAEIITAEVEAGKITPTMRRTDVMALVAAHAPPPRPDAPAVPLRPLEECRDAVWQARDHAHPAVRAVAHGPHPELVPEDELRAYVSRLGRVKNLTRQAAGDGEHQAFAGELLDVITAEPGRADEVWLAWLEETAPARWLTSCAELHHLEPVRQHAAALAADVAERGRALDATCAELRRSIARHLAEAEPPAELEDTDGPAAAGDSQQAMAELALDGTPGDSHEDLVASPGGVPAGRDPGATRSADEDTTAGDPPAPPAVAPSTDDPAPHPDVHAAYTCAICDAGPDHPDGGTLESRPRSELGGYGDALPTGQTFGYVHPCCHEAPDWRDLTPPRRNAIGAAIARGGELDPRLAPSVRDWLRDHALAHPDPVAAHTTRLTTAGWHAARNLAAAGLLEQPEVEGEAEATEQAPELEAAPEPEVEPEQLNRVQESIAADEQRRLPPEAPRSRTLADGRTLVDTLRGLEAVPTARARDGIEAWCAESIGRTGGTAEVAELHALIGSLRGDLLKDLEYITASP